MGCSTGHGAHGDYLFGWVDGSLQKAMDTLGTECFSETCPPLKLQLGKLAIACTKAQQAKEDIGNGPCRLTFLFHKYRLIINRAPNLAGWYGCCVGHRRNEGF